MNGSPIEVWLTQKNIAITCRVFNEDETADNPNVASLSMRGAQREMTSRLIGQGYDPVGRWEIVTDGETVRRFRAKAA